MYKFYSFSFVALLGGYFSLAQAAAPDSATPEPSQPAWRVIEGEPVSLENADAYYKAKKKKLEEQEAAKKLQEESVNKTDAK